MPEDREMTPADFQTVTKDCVARTVNFHGPVPLNRPLSWFQLDSDSEIALLKDLLTGKNNPEIGVTHFLYRLDRNALNTIDSTTTVFDLSELVKNASIPDMTNRRAMLVITGSASHVGQTVPQPDPSHPLSEIGINGENVDDFKKTVVKNPIWGVERFRRMLDEDELDDVTEETLVGDVIDILKQHAEPLIDTGDQNA